MNGICVGPLVVGPSVGVDVNVGPDVAGFAVVGKIDGDALLCDGDTVIGTRLVGDCERVGDTVIGARLVGDCVGDTVVGARLIGDCVGDTVVGARLVGDCVGTYDRTIANN